MNSKISYRRQIRLVATFLVSSVLILLEVNSAKSDTLNDLNQFNSDNSATVLGLEKKDSISETDIKLAARRLLTRYHPDRYAGANFSEADRARANEITRKILAAQESLVNYIKINPSFSPSKDGGSSGPTGASQSGGPAQSNDRFYTWQDFASEMEKDRARAGSSVVTMDHYGSSLRGTMFEFLYQFPSANMAFLELHQASARTTNHDAIMVLRPEIFPNVEFRIISRDRDGNATQVVKSVFARYVRGHHQGNGGRHLVDAIVFEDGSHFPKGSYLMPGFVGQIRYKGEVTPEMGDKAVRMTGHPQAMFLFMKPSGYSDPEHGGYISDSAKPISQFLTRKPPTPAVDPVKNLGWKDVSVSYGSADPIQLGFDPTSCGNEFGSLKKKKKK